MFHVKRVWRAGLAHYRAVANRREEVPYEPFSIVCRPNFAKFAEGKVLKTACWRADQEAVMFHVKYDRGLTSTIDVLLARRSP